MKRVFYRLRKYNVKLNLDKCEFSRNSEEFLGHRIDSEGIHPTDEKIKAIFSINSPTSVTELKSLRYRFLNVCVQIFSAPLSPLCYMVF